MTNPRFKFNMRYVSTDPSGYYYTRWDRSKPITVIAPNKSEAFSKLWVVLGPCDAGRQGDVWTAVIDSVEEVAM